MKISVFTPAMVLVGILSGCESSTTGPAAPILPGSAAPALVGTWRDVQASPGASVDTQTLVLSDTGSLSSVSHGLEWTNGTVHIETRCSYSGTWSVAGSQFFSSMGGVCTEVSGTVGTAQLMPTVLDTAWYAVQGSTLVLIHHHSTGYDTTYLTKI